MNHYYKDIMDKINEEPQWFDEEAVPRYCKFSPKQIANIYADECALVLIACQSCRRKFRVAMSQSKVSFVSIMRQQLYGEKPLSLTQQIKRGSIHYGDPPNVECCPAGATMNCEDLKVLEYWHRRNLEWERDKELEIDLPDAR